eukprot:scaffold1722_cov110-Isochrysis_galbana.AAC.3
MGGGLAHSHLSKTPKYRGRHGSGKPPTPPPLMCSQQQSVPEHQNIRMSHPAISFSLDRCFKKSALSTGLVKMSDVLSADATLRTSTSPSA